jgi:hypothetical protein
MPRCRTLVLATLVAAGALPAQTMRLVGKSDLGGKGLNGDLTIVGSTAVVAAGMMPAAGVHAHLYNPYPCPAVSVKLVDLSQPGRPRIVSEIPVPAGVAAHGVSAARVRTPSFTGDLLAVALTMCSSAGTLLDRGVAYYDITRPAAPQLLGRYHADDDIEHADSVPACGPPPLSSARCASSQHSVALMQRPDGRVLSLSIEPGAAASKYPSGDLRVVDVSDPRRPSLIGSYPPAGTPIFSNNGCRPFSAGHGAGFSHDGTRAMLAFYDGGLFILDVAKGAPSLLGQFTYPNERSLEASAAYVASARVDGRDLALISEADFIAPSTTLHVQGPAAITGAKFACEAVFTLFDPANAAQLYRRPGGVQGELAYVGRGCPVSPGPDAMHSMTPTMREDPYLADVRDRIALIDRARHQALQPNLPDGPGCSVAERARRAQALGARAVVFLQTSATAPQAFSPDGDPAGLTIPVVMIDKGDADALRSALCPKLEQGRCAPSAPVRGHLSDGPGAWGALRVVDVSDPARPTEAGVVRPPNACVYPPKDLGVSSPQRAAVRGRFAAVPWNSDGVRLIELSRSTPREVASFVPPDTRDPTGVLPAKAYVMSTGILTLAGGPEYVVLSDINSGLYVLEAPWTRGTADALDPQRLAPESRPGVC